MIISEDIHVTVARYSRDSSATLVLQHGNISACLVNELDMKEIVIISEKMVHVYLKPIFRVGWREGGR